MLQNVFYWRIIKKTLRGEKGERQMKKILSMLLVIATMLTVCMSLVACGGPKPNTNFKQAEKKLEKRDYSIEIMEGEDMFAEYQGALAIEEILYAVSDDGDDVIVILKLDSKKSAKLLYKTMQELYGTKGSNYKFTKYYLKKYGKDLEDSAKKRLKADLKTMEKTICGHSGRYVWYGTKKAIKDSK